MKNFRIVLLIVFICLSIMLTFNIMSKDTMQHSSFYVKRVIVFTSIDKANVFLNEYESYSVNVSFVYGDSLLICITYKEYNYK